MKSTMTFGIQTARAAALLCLTAAAFLGATARAQTATSPEPQADSSGAASPAVLQEITVTATRRAEPLQQVPISVAAFTAQTLAKQGVHDIDTLSNLTPGLTFQRNGSAEDYNDEGSDINIRGIDSNAGAATTGVYIDDTPITSRHLGFGNTSVYPAVFDLDRVEVLRGPQGTLFGAGSEGGTVRFILPEPSLHQTEVYALADAASTDNGAPSYEVGAALGAPIIAGTLGLRISASSRYDGGYVDRVGYTYPNPQILANPMFNGDVMDRHANWMRTDTFRIALRWSINDHVVLTPSFYYQYLHLNDTGAYWPGLSNPGAAVFRQGDSLPNTSTDPFWVSAVRLNWDLGFAQFISTTSYFWRDQHSVSNYTNFDRALYYDIDTAFGVPGLTPWPAPGDAGWATLEDKQNNIFEEDRLVSEGSGKLSWTVGLFLAHMREAVPEFIFDPNIDAEYGACAGVGIPCPNGEILAEPTQEVTDKEAALYGNATYALTPTFKVTAGVRVADDRYDGTVTQGGAIVGVPLTSPIQSTTPGKEHPVTPKAVLTWQPARDRMMYVSASKGYRVGGINADVGAVCGLDLANLGLNGTPTTYRSDSLWSYELGTKDTFAHRFQVDASVYWIDWKDIQQNVYLQDCGNQFVANLGAVHSRGGDIDMRLQALDSLVLGLTAAYTDATFAKSVCAGNLTFNGTQCTNSTGAARDTIVRAGNKLAGAPWRFVGTMDYTFRRWSDGALPYFHADFAYTTAQTGLSPGQDPNNGGDLTIPGLPVTRSLDLRAGMRWRGFDASLYANNVTNTAPVLFETRDVALPFDQLYFAHTWRPRTIGITGTYRY
jgi:iron complex outermembrane receptor protein